MVHPFEFVNAPGMETFLFNLLTPHFFCVKIHISC